MLHMDPPTAQEGQRSADLSGDERREFEELDPSAISDKAKGYAKLELCTFTRGRTLWRIVRNLNVGKPRRLHANIVSNSGAIGLGLLIHCKMHHIVVDDPPCKA
jgi:hypothetical protein